MTSFRVLLADNDIDNLKTNAEFLRLMDFEVVTTETPDETQSLLTNDWVHVAVLDMRLSVNEDEKDRSGLQIALRAAPAVPKLILTAFPAFQDVVEAMRPNERPFPHVINYLSKQETNLNDLAEAVNQALIQHVGLNQALHIDWRGVAPAQLVNLLEPQLSSFFLASRLREVEDLLRKLFPTACRLMLEAPLATQNGRLLLPAYAFDQDGRETQLLISIGQPNIIAQERKSYDTYLGGRTTLGEIGRLSFTETTHFGAASYRFPNQGLAAASTFATYYRYQPVPLIVDAVTKLFTDRLGRWYQSGFSHDHSDSQHTFFQNRFDIADLLQDQAYWQKVHEVLCQQAKLLLPNLFVCDDAQITLKFEGFPVTLPIPGDALDDMLEQPNGQATWGIAHGNVCPSCVLIDGAGEVWLIDFSHIGRSPLLLDFVRLETAVKFAATVALPSLAQQMRFDMLLAQADDFSIELPEDETLPPIVQKMIAVVEEIRLAAQAHARCSWQAYQLGLFYTTAACFRKFEPSQPTARHETAVLLRLYATLAALSHKDDPPAPSLSFTLDDKSQQIFINEEEIFLSTQEFAIMLYLYRKAGEVCTRQQIIEQGLGDPFDHYADERLNTAVSRLRTKLEQNAPRILKTVRGRGYRLDIP